MPPPTRPGAHVEEVPDLLRTIGRAPTSITAFVGRARQGPVGQPVPVQSFAEFDRTFGGLWRESTMSYAVHHFFLNGGADALIVRAFNSDLAGAGGVAPHDHAGFTTTFTLPGAGGSLSLAARDPGAWGDQVQVFVERDAAPPGTGTFHLVIQQLEAGVVRRSETCRDLSTEEGHPRHAQDVLARQSELVRVAGYVPGVLPHPSPRDPDGQPIPAGIAVHGRDGGPIGYAQVAGPHAEAAGVGLHALAAAEHFNLLCIPPYEHGRDVDVQCWEAALACCQRRRALLMVDPPTAWRDPAAVLDRTIGVDGTSAAVPARDANAVLYFPRVLAADPLRQNRLTEFAPSGMLAGLFTRTDARQGVWKAPAGRNATLLGARQPAYAMTDAATGRLNPRAVNALRTLPGAGVAAWGARTMVGTDGVSSEWKYIPVRRMALHIEESLHAGTRWALYEPNGAPLWEQIRLAAGSFMHDLFRQGAFSGSSPDKAYYVRCDASTTTRADIDQGMANLVVGFAPLKPAEFVVLGIRLRTGADADSRPGGPALPAVSHAGRLVRMPRARIEPLATWEDLVLPEPRLRQLRDIAARVRRNRLRSANSDTASLVPCTTALFAGGSGTGRSMAAEVLARDLGLELHRIDLRGLASEYIGETEKNLDRVLDGVAGLDAVLLLDEGDALCGRRTAVGDGPDRYAEAVTDHLLRRLEGCGGLAILEVRRGAGVEEACRRRRCFVVPFAEPDARLRAAIWRRAFPPDTPTEGLDVDALARRQMSGARIRALAGRAAFLAAEEDAAVRMSHILRAGG